MQNRTVLVTGATNGIGEVAALELARKGASVVVASRTPSKCEATVRRIQTETGNPNVSYLVADLATTDGAKQLAVDFHAKHDRLHVLLNNAGAIFPDRQTTAEGYEKTFALNHLGYYSLTGELVQLLVDTAAQDGQEARIVNVSSGAHRFNGARMHWDDLEFAQGYGSMKAYSQSKLANLLFTFELARRLRGTHVTTNAVHPGMVATGFGGSNGFLWDVLLMLMRPFAKSAAEGAQTSIYVASSDAVTGVTGEYFADSQIQQPDPAARDESAQQRLWRISEKMTGIHYPTVAPEPSGAVG